MQVSLCFHQVLPYTAIIYCVNLTVEPLHTEHYKINIHAIARTPKLQLECTGIKDYNS